MLAQMAGWRPERADAGELLLRAQLVLAAAIGTVSLRSSGLEPIASVTATELSGPMRRLLDATLGDGRATR